MIVSKDDFGDVMFYVSMVSAAIPTAFDSMSAALYKGIRVFIGSFISSALDDGSRSVRLRET